MGKRELKEELEKQIKEKNVSKWISDVFIMIGLLLTITIVFAIIGIPILIIAIINDFNF